MSMNNGEDDDYILFDHYQPELPLLQHAENMQLQKIEELFAALGIAPPPTYDTFAAFNNTADYQNNMGDDTGYGTNAKKRKSMQTQDEDATLNVQDLAKEGLQYDGTFIVPDAFEVTNKVGNSTSSKILNDDIPITTNDIKRQRRGQQDDDDPYNMGLPDRRGMNRGRPRSRSPSPRGGARYGGHYGGGNGRNNNYNGNNNSNNNNNQFGQRSDMVILNENNNPFAAPTLQFDDELDMATRAIQRRSMSQRARARSRSRARALDLDTDDKYYETNDATIRPSMYLPSALPLTAEQRKERATSRQRSLSRHSSTNGDIAQIGGDLQSLFAGAAGGGVVGAAGSHAASSRRSTASRGSARYSNPFVNPYDIETGSQYALSNFDLNISKYISNAKGAGIDVDEKVLTDRNTFLNMMQSARNKKNITDDETRRQLARDKHYDIQKRLAADNGLVDYEEIEALRGLENTTAVKPLAQPLVNTFAQAQYNVDDINNNNKQDTPFTQAEFAMQKQLLALNGGFNDNAADAQVRKLELAFQAEVLQLQQHKIISMLANFVKADIDANHALHSLYTNKTFDRKAVRKYYELYYQEYKALQEYLESIKIDNFPPSTPLETIRLELYPDEQNYNDREVYITYLELRLAFESSAKAFLQHLMFLEPAAMRYAKEQRRAQASAAPVMYSNSMNDD